MNDRLNCVGLAVEEKRRKLKWTLQDLATRAQVVGWDVDKKILSRIENGTRRITDNEVYYLSVIFKCDLPSLYPSRRVMDATFLRSNAPKRKR